MTEHSVFDQRVHDQHARVSNASGPGLWAKLLLGLLVMVALLMAGCGSQAGSGTPGNDNGTAPQSTLPPAAVPPGFQTYTGSDFSIAYPSDWQVSGDEHNQGTGVLFQSAVENFQVFNFGTNASAGNNFCTVYGPVTAGPTSTSIGGAQWTRQECAGQEHAVVESVNHNGSFFVIVYEAPIAAFASDQSHVFTPMEQSFRFLS